MFGTFLWLLVVSYCRVLHFILFLNGLGRNGLVSYSDSMPTSFAYDFIFYLFRGITYKTYNMHRPWAKQKQ